MLHAETIAKYILERDKDGSSYLFPRELEGRKQERFDKGNIRLNQYLHIFQNLWIAKTGEKLFAENMVAEKYGGVVPEVWERYLAFAASEEMSPDVAVWIDKMCNIMDYAEVYELTDYTLDDPEWEAKIQGKDRRMDSLARAEEYRRLYENTLVVQGINKCAMGVGRADPRTSSSSGEGLLDSLTISERIC